MLQALSVLHLVLGLTALASAARYSFDNPSEGVPALLAVGTFDTKIHVLEYDPDKRSFQAVSTVEAGHQPTAVRFGAFGRTFFAVDSVDSIDGQAEGSLTSFKVGSDASLTKVTTVATPSRPVDLSISPDGSSILVASLMAGSSARYSLGSNAVITPEEAVQEFNYHGHGPVPGVQAHSFIFDAQYTPFGTLALFSDRGGDRIYVHRVSSGTLSGVVHEIKFPEGSGPRKFYIETNGENNYDIYVNCQLKNRIFNVRLTDDGTNLESQVKQELPSIRGDQAESTILGGAIAVTKDGKFLYSSNRQIRREKPQSDNTMVVYARKETGELYDAKFYQFTSGGSDPRDFTFYGDAEQSLMMIAFASSDTVSVYSRDKSTGAIEHVASTTVKAAASVEFFPVSGKSARPRKPPS